MLTSSKPAYGGARFDRETSCRPVAAAEFSWTLQYCVGMTARGGAADEIGEARPRWLPRWVREALFVGAIYVAYEACRGFQQGGIGIATRNGRDILRWERALDLAPEHLMTQALINITPLAVVAAYFYSTMHYVITPVVLVWLYRRHADHYRTARTSLAISTMVGLLVFYLVPTAPPRLLRGAGVPDALFDTRNWGWWGSDGSVPKGLGGVTNQFAAMPSLHVGWALWCGFLVFRYASRAWVRWLGLAYPVVTTLVVLSTGNHYLLDAVAGALVMALGAGVALLLNVARRRLARPRAKTATRPVAPVIDPAAAAARSVPAPKTAQQWASGTSGGASQPARSHACVRR